MTVQTVAVVDCEAKSSTSSTTLNVAFGVSRDRLRRLRELIVSLVLALDWEARAR